MGWFKQHYLWIIVSAVCVSCQELISTLPRNVACPRDEVTFTCTIRGTEGLTSLILAWSSPEYIGQGDPLRFTTEDVRGTNRTSMINRNVTATLTNNAVVDGVPELVSVLRIVADQASVVTCTSETSGGTASTKMLNISVVPGVPQNVTAEEISESAENDCFILVKWNPPAKTDESDIDHYMVYVPSRNIMEMESSTRLTLSVSNCRDEIRIQVAAVNSFGCFGLNSSEIQPSPYKPPTAPDTSTIIAVAVAGLIILVLIMAVGMIVIVTLCLHKQQTEERQKVHELEKTSMQGNIQRSLKDLYTALKCDPTFEKKSAVRLRAILKISPVHVIKEKLQNLLDALKWEKRDDLQRFLDRLRDAIQDMPNTDTVTTAKTRRNDDLKDTFEMFSKAVKSSEDELQNAMDILIGKVVAATPDEIKESLLELCDWILKVPKLSPEQEEVVRKFEISLESLREIEELLTAEFVKGLARERDDVKVKMLNTHVHEMPKGTEEGEFLVVDLGVINLRVLLIRIYNRKLQPQGIEAFRIDDSTRQSSQEVLFDFIADSVAKFIREREIKEKLHVGFAFSFPVKQESLVSGKLIRWTNDFKVTGAVGKDVVQLLKDAFVRKRVVEVDVVALVGYTTATQLAVGKEVPDCSIGLNLCVGANACYMERVDAVPKFRGDCKNYSQVIINTEWGAFGDDGKLDDWRTDYDCQLDKESTYPNEQLFEKMISDKYLGSIIHLALKDLNSRRALFGEASFAKLKAFDAKGLTNIEKGDMGDRKKMLKTHFSIEASDQDCEVVRRVCEAVSTRAARLTAAGIVALVKKIKKIDGCTVAVDGGLYKRHPNFADRMRTAMDELAPGNKIKIKSTPDGSGQGAAIAAAMAIAGKSESPRGRVGWETMKGQQEESSDDGRPTVVEEEATLYENHPGGEGWIAMARAPVAAHQHRQPRNAFDVQHDTSEIREESV